MINPIFTHRRLYVLALLIVSSTILISCDSQSDNDKSMFYEAAITGKYMYGVRPHYFEMIRTGTNSARMKPYTLSRNECYNEAFPEVIFEATTNADGGYTVDLGNTVVYLIPTERGLLSRHGSINITEAEYINTEGFRHPPCE